MQHRIIYESNTEETPEPLSINDVYPHTLFEDKNYEKKEQFDQEDFVERLTYKLLNEAKKDNLYYGWKRKNQNFLQLFSEAVTELKSLLNNAEDETLQLMKKTKASEKEYSKIQEKTFASFNSSSIEEVQSLDDKMNHAGSIAVQIVHRLENFHSRKQRAKKAINLIKYFKEFNDPDTHNFIRDIVKAEKMSSVFLDPKRRDEAISIAGELHQSIRYSSSDQCANGKRNVKTYVQYLEDEILEEFEKYLTDIGFEENEKHIHELKRCIDLCRILDSPVPCIKTFIHKRCEQYDEKFNWTNDSDSQERRDLRHYRYNRMDQIKQAYNNESDIIRKIFEEDSKSVLFGFFQRVVKTSISRYVKRILPEASVGWHTLVTHLDILHTLYTITLNTFYSLNLDPNERESLMNMIFQKYTKDYVINELICQELYLKEKLSTGNEIKLHHKESKEPIIENPVNTTIIMECLKFNEEGIERCKKLSDRFSRGDNLIKIFEKLIKAMHTNLERGIQTAVRFLQHGVHKDEEKRLKTCFEIIHYEHVAIGNLYTTLQTLMPELSSGQKSAARLLLKQNLLAPLSSEVEEALNLAVEIACHRAKDILDPPKKFYQVGKPKQQILGDGRSSSCRDLLKFLDDLLVLVDSCLFGANKERFLLILGNQLFRIIQGHTCMEKNLSNERYGAIVADLGEYERWFEVNFPLPEIRDLFARLPMLGKLPMLTENGLKEFIQVELRQKRNIPFNDIDNFLRMRKDYSQISSDLFKEF
eukprot:gb/GECH01005419.1/.p1 GENE.gb/GECH01005419.1/~~gb/GECH01005419.1/.p1  ORF type:complete len:758 (+),score=167.77 gb/GECH01005419.1/:1-2274(+)